MDIKEAVTYITNEVDIIDYLTTFEQMQFKKHGSNFKTLCCFHDDKDPSLVVSVGKPMWYCFGCKQGGNLVKFVELKYGINRLQAIKTILQNLNIDMTQFLGEIEQETITGHNILKTAQDYFINCAGKSKTYAEYFLGKGYKDLNSLMQEGVGYCDSVDKLTEYLVKKGFTDKEIWTYDLVNEYYNQSIVYTVYDASGNINHFMYRSFGDVKFFTGSKSILHDSDILLGIHALKSQNYVIFVEGNSDWLALKLAGYNVLCMGGLKINVNILDKLNLYDIVDIYYWVDGDQAGWKFINELAKQYGELFCSRNLTAKAIYIDGSDPDELVLSNFNVKNAMENTDIIPIYYINQFLSVKWQDDNQKSYALIRHIAKLSKNFDKLTSNYVVQYLHSKTGFDIDAIDDELARFINENLSDYKLEQYLIAWILNTHDAIIQYNINVDWFYYKAFRTVFSLIVEKKANLISINSLSPSWVLPHISQLPVVDENIIDDIIKNVRDLYQRRSIYNIGKNLLRNNRSFEDGLNFLNESIIKLYGIYQTQVLPVSNIVDQIINESKNKIQIHSMKLGTGWAQTDAILHGIIPKKLIYIMGNTGHGKTTLALNWVNCLSVEQNYRGLIISGEMDSMEITERLMAIATGMGATDIIIRNLAEKDIYKLVEIRQKIESGNIQIHTVMEIDHMFNLIKYAKLKFNIDYVILDYLQLISPSFYMKGMTRTQQLREVTRRMKVDVCGVLGLSAIILGQLGDVALDNETPQARYSSESKLIQADADVIIAIRQKNQKEKELEPIGDIIYHIDKCRYNKGKKVLRLLQDNVNLRITEVGI